MKRGTILLAICIGIALLITLIIQHSTQAQRSDTAGDRPSRRRFGGGQMMMSRMLPIEEMWSQMSFELGVPDEVLLQVRKICQETWIGRKKLIKKMTDAGGDRTVLRSMRQDVEKLKTDMMDKLKDVLTVTQLEKLAAWEKQYEARTRTPPRPPSPRQSPR